MGAKGILLALGALLLWGLSAGCHDAARQIAPKPKKVIHDGGTFRLAQASPRNLDPARLESVYESTVVNQIFDGLVAFDENLNTVPSLAESWTISQDGTVYTFHIKHGVHFHDGSEVTANDFAYSITRTFQLPEDQTELAREYLSHIKGTDEFAKRKVDHITGIEVLSPYEVRITLKRPFAAFLMVLAMDCGKVVPKHYVMSMGTEEFGRHPVGAGPFVFEKWVQDEEIVLTAFDDYHLGRAHLDSLVFETPKNDRRDYATNAFLRTQLDLLEVQPGQVDDLEQRAGIKLTSRQELSLTFLALNLEKKPFDDRRVRQAFAMAVDRKNLFGTHDSSRMVPCGILPPGMPGYTRISKLLPHDHHRAMELLAEAGYPDGKGLPPIELVTGDQSAQATVFYAKLASELAEVGFKVTNEHLSWLDFFSRLKAGDGGCFTLNWVADIPDPDSFLYPLFHSHGATNYVHYKNENVDELLDAGRRARSSLDRLQVYREAEQMIVEDAPMVPLFHTVTILAARDQVKGLDLTPMGIGNLNLRKVWFEPVQVAQGAGQ
ncbi:MAG TPA: ABC transporter substrate-binding protein [Candidatus Krumholzibacteria bacterium]|nr:ABC transporter substrate-binding protein [Candidatus Krumholzibacteria bacterium]